jgi:hypothetical protein
MANQLRLMQQMIKETQMTDRAITSTLHNDIADQIITGELPSLNVSQKSQHAQARKRV